MEGVDRLGRLQVGTKSAGSDLGPAAFGKGGTNPTVTDTDIALGLIEPSRLTEGWLQVDRDASDQFLLREVGHALELDASASGLAISEIVDEDIASAGRMHAVESGKALETRTMIAFGGNGPLHATRVARRARVGRILIPRDPGIGSAVGFLMAPVSFEIVRSRYATLDALDTEDLLAFCRGDAALKALDTDFRHLFGSWFNREFFEIRRIDRSTSADILEKVIAYEAVHEINGWDDLRQRVGDPDRRLFGFFHPAMPSEPPIFVEVALTRDVLGAIAPILNAERDRVDPEDTTTPVFYSISNCQKRRRGISFGNFLIKQVVVELQRELPGLETFVTLSPVPGLRRWVAGAIKDKDGLLTDQECQELSTLADNALPDPEFAARLAARYLVRAKRPIGTAFDPVVQFHLGNGAMPHTVHPDTDKSERGVGGSWGVMVNCLYDGDNIQARHHGHATTNEIAASAKVLALAEEYGDSTCTTPTTSDPACAAPASDTTSEPFWKTFKPDRWSGMASSSPTRRRSPRFCKMRDWNRVTVLPFRHPRRRPCWNSMWRPSWRVACSCRSILPIPGPSWTIS